MEYPVDWPANHAEKIRVMDHFSLELYCPNFERRWNNRTPEFKLLFYNFLNAVHNARFDLYGDEAAGGNLRIGYKPPDGNGQYFASITFDGGGRPRLEWNHLGEAGLAGNLQIDLDLVNRFSDEIFLANLRRHFLETGGIVRQVGDEAYWPDGYRQDILVGGGTIELPLAQENNTKMNLNTILYGPPGTGKTHSVTALSLSILEDHADQLSQAKQYSSAILNESIPRRLTDAEWRDWTRDFDMFVKSGRVEVTTFHQNYAYEDFIEGLKASVKRQEDGTNVVVYNIEPGTLKRIAYRALYAWLTGRKPEDTPEAAVLTEGQLTTVLSWLKDGKWPENGRSVKATAPPYVLIIDEINRGNVARVLGELITLVEDSKRARQPGEIEQGDQPMFATLPYSKESFILPPNLFIIGTMNTADRSLIGLDAALRRRFEFVELAPKPDLLVDFGDGANLVSLSALLKKLNDNINRLDNSSEHAIGHAYFMGVRDVHALAAVMSRKVIPQLREYFHDRRERIAEILSPDMRPGSSVFVDEYGRIKVGSLNETANYQHFYNLM